MPGRSSFTNKTPRSLHSITALVAAGMEAGSPHGSGLATGGHAIPPVERHAISPPEGMAGPKWDAVIRRQVFNLETTELIEDIRVEPGKPETDCQHAVSSLGLPEQTANLRV